MYEGVSPRFAVSKFLGQLEDCQGVIRAVTEVCVALLVEVCKHVVLIDFLIRSKLVHPVEKGDESIAKTLAD